MVSTRQHPSDFPPPEASPIKRSRYSQSPAPAASGANRAVSNSITSSLSSSSPPWAHTASNITIAWICVSLPLVIWDCLYILLRPHTMKGGWLQWPFWKPYEIYAEIDHVYGLPAWESGDGFGGAQGAVNAIETILYGLYIMIVYNHSVPSTSGKGLQVGEGVKGFLSGGRKVYGKAGNKALIIGFTAAVMTLSKTVLYYLNEYYSGFHNTKHNDWVTLALFYGIMNGLWVVFPAYMTIVFGSDILEGLEVAAEPVSRKKD